MRQRHSAMGRTEPKCEGTKSDFFKVNGKCCPNDSVGCVLQKQMLETPALANDAETMPNQEKRLRPIVDGMGVIAKSENV